MLLAASVSVLPIDGTTKHSVDLKVGQTLYFPQVEIGQTLNSPSITLVKADWEICTFIVRLNPRESTSKVVDVTYGLEIEGILAGNLTIRVGCWGDKLSVEYSFQKLELAI